MALDFPTVPTVGQKYPEPAIDGVPQYKWDGEKWAAGSPASMATGPVRYDVAQTLTTAQQEQARTNIHAAPFDALAFNGMQINGCSDISQETGLSAVALPSGSGVYLGDMWQGVFIGASGGVCQGGIAPNGGFPGITNAEYIRATTGAPLTSAGDMAGLATFIEGYRLLRCGFGTAAAMPVTVAFLVNSTIAGTMAVALNNGANNRGCVKDVVINAANTWEYKIVTFPGDVTGTWDKDSGLGLQVFFTAGAGSAIRTSTPGVWGAGQFRATPSTTNLMANNGNQMTITGVMILPGSEAPPQDRVPLIQRPANTELVLCQRYLQYRFAAIDIQAAVATVVGIATVGYSPEVRTTPALSINQVFQQSNIGAGTQAFFQGGVRGCAVQVQAAAAARAYYYAEVKVNARF